VLKALGENSQREHLDTSYGFVPSCSISQNAGQLRDLRNPPPVGFALTLDVEIQHGNLQFGPILRATLK